MFPELASPKLRRCIVEASTNMFAKHRDVVIADLISPCGAESLHVCTACVLESAVLKNEPRLFKFVVDYECYQSSNVEMFD